MFTAGEGHDTLRHEMGVIPVRKPRRACDSPASGGWETPLPQSRKGTP